MTGSLQKYNGNANLTAWAEMVGQCRASELKVEQWCKENHIALSTYYSRQKKVCAAMEAAAVPEGFFEIKSKPVRETPAATLHLGEISADLYAGADAETIAAIIRAFRSC